MSKTLVDVIKKMAQDGLTDPPGINTAPVNPSIQTYKHPHDSEFVGPLTTPTRSSGGSFPVIKDMQNALINLANSVMKEDIDSKSDLSKNKSTFATKIKVIRDEAERLNMVNSKNFADGQWGPITNTALHNTVVLAMSLLNLAADYPSTVNAYKQKDLEEFKQLIQNEPSDLTITEKLQNAPEITKNLNLLRQTYEELKNEVKKSETFQPYETNDAKLSPERLTELNTKFNDMTVTVGTNPPMPITVHDLVDENTLLAWRNKNLPHEDLYQIVTALKTQLSEKV